MIITNIMCGLGNQMFQYAAGRALAYKLNTDLKIALDKESFDENKDITSFQLDKFNIVNNFAKDVEADIAKPKNFFLRAINFLRTTLKKVAFLKKIVCFLRTYLKMPIVPNFFNDAVVFNEAKEKDWTIKYKPELLDMPDGTFLYGYFSSYKYFDNIRDIIVKDFTLKAPLSSQSQEVEDKITKTNSISLHLRRGDAVKNPMVAAWYKDIVTDKYYQNAIDYMAKHVANPHFFIFSNDIGWVKENFKIPFAVTYVDHNTTFTAYEDLHLMSKCKHNITTGGSSFAWWAAYLNQNQDKIVIRTKNVCGDVRLNFPDEFFPKDWIIVES